MENLAESNSTLVSKVPMLKPKEFDMWKIRIKQYIHLTDYSIWEIIENGPCDEGRIGADGKRPPPKTDADKKIRQTEMKALSTLLLAIPNEYQHQFQQCTDAQMLWNALEKRFKGTKSTQRNQKAILRQQYENFMSTKNESMTQTFDRFNKLIGELATVGVQIDADDVNRKFLRSLGEEWTMYTVSFRQNDQLEDKDLDDLYNDLRVFEAEVESKKKPSGYVHNAALLSAAETVSIANTETVNAANGNSQDKSHDSVFEALFTSNANSSLLNDDLEQINADDLEEMDIKWQMAMLSMRVKRFIKRTGRNNFSQKREDGAGFDKSKVECYKCHKMGHFARECRGGGSQTNHQQAQSGNYNRSSSQALVSQQGMGFDWSDQAEEAIQNQALMAEVSDLPSEVQSNLCSQACINTVKRYRDHNQGMSDNLKRLEKDIKDYVLIVEKFEEQIRAFQANELQHSYDTKYWAWEKNDLELQVKLAKDECEKEKEKVEKLKLELKSEKEKLEKFSSASKIMDNIINSQVHSKSKPGIGYNATPPPYNNNYIPPKSDLLETKDRKTLPEGATEVDPIDVVVENKPESSTKVDPSPQVVHVQSRQSRVTQTPVLTSNNCQQCFCKHKPHEHNNKRGNQRNWNQQWADRQGVNLKRINRPNPCFICGKLNHLAKHCYFNPMNQRMNFNRSSKSSFGKNGPNKAFKSQPKKRNSKKKGTEQKGKKIWVEKKEPVNTDSFNSTVSVESAASSNTSKATISTKYSSTSIPKVENLIPTEYSYIDEHGQPKTTLAWVPNKTN